MSVRKKAKNFVDWLIEQVKKADIPFDTIPRATVKERLRFMEEREHLAGYNQTRTLRIDEEMERDIDLIALNEREKPGTLMRMWVQDRILSYKQNPKYKRWKKEFETART